MSETAPNPNAGQAGQPLTVNIQYVKDLSFEVPNAPAIYSTLRAQPNVAINLDVQARRIQDGQDVFEVTLKIKADATEPAAGGATNGSQPAPVFIAELSYCGIFTLNGSAREYGRAGPAGGMPAAAVPVCSQHPGRRDA